MALGVVAGIAVVAGLVAWIVFQQGQSGSDPNAKWAAMESDPAPGLPGELVDLTAIYGGSYGGMGEGNTAQHVQRDVDYVADGNSTPPAGGPHWGASVCGEDPTAAPPFCGPVGRGYYEEPWEAASLVHSMEHAHVILWYNTEDEDLKEQLLDFASSNSDKLLVVTPYPDMEEETIALTAWARIDKFPAGEWDPDRAKDFVSTFECRFDPESIC